MAYIALIVVVFLSLFVVPVSAHAGFFSSIIRFFSSGDGDVIEEVAAEAVSLPLLGSSATAAPGPIGIGGPDEEDATPVIAATLDSALVSTKNPSGILPPAAAGQIFIYTVAPGDTPGLIAERFGISLNTLLWANNIRNSNLVRVGDELVILPVSGVRYEVKKGDSIDSIAKKFKGDSADILYFNGLGIGDTLEAGSVVIIPDGELPASVTPPGSRTQVASLPVFQGYYMRPIFGGRRSRGIHGYNGIDLANGCGLPVVASAEGTIILSRASGWNGGYGKYMVLTHPNGTQTLYAHLSSILASVGQKVSQGTQIAKIGSTGNSTGCHVHFEVRGAKNPF